MKRIAHKSHSVISLITATAMALILLAVNLPAQEPAERYYMVLFGAQSNRVLRESHTWATFVRTQTDAAGERVISVDTISWLPATLKVRPFALRPETGANLTLDQTFDWIVAVGAKSSYWGPYEIDSERYHRFISRKEELDSGVIEYRAIGGIKRNSRISNCGQSFARSSPIVGNRYIQPTPVPGEKGTSHLALRYLRAGALLGAPETHEDIAATIGLPNYPAVQRQPGERIRVWRGN
jgi:hypothetical protein